MLIKAAINGGRTKAEHAAVPISPQEQAATVVECLQAGAGAIHLHVRGTTGDNLDAQKESLYAEDVTRTLLAARAAAPKSAIGVSTGAWILPQLAERLQAVAKWDVLPDFASVNFIEEGATELALQLLSRGVNIEAGLSDANAAQSFVGSELAARCLRILIEPQEQEMEEALANVRAIEKVLASHEAAREPALSQLPRLLHGTEATAWPMLDYAIRRGYGVRIGLEDTLFMPDGRMARDNTELVTEAVRRVKISGR